MATTYTAETISAMTSSELWDAFMGSQSRREWLAIYNDQSNGFDLDVESTLRVDLDANGLTSDLDSEAKDALAAKLAAYLA